MLVTKENISETQGQMLYHVNPYGINNPNDLRISEYKVITVTDEEVYYTHCYMNYLGKRQYTDSRSYIRDMIREHKRTFTLYYEAEQYIDELKQNGIPEQVLSHNRMCEGMFSDFMLHDYDDRDYELEG